MRDRASRVLPAQALLRDLFASRPEVLVELELIEIHAIDIGAMGSPLDWQARPLWSAKEEDGVVL